MGLVIMIITGCLGSPVVGDWEIRDFQRFEIDGTSFSTSDEDGDLAMESTNDVDCEFDFRTAKFGRLAWDLSGEWENDGGGVYLLVLDGDIQFTNRDGQAASLDVDGEWDCRPERDRMECEGDLDAPVESDESYSFEIEWELR